MNLINMFKKDEPTTASQDSNVSEEAIDLTRNEEINNHLLELANGRQESDIPMNDDYWKKKAEYQQELHRLNGEF